MTWCHFCTRLGLLFPSEHVCACLLCRLCLTLFPASSGMADEASGDRSRRKRDAPQKAFEGVSDQAGKTTKGAKAKPTKDATGPKKEPKAATNRGKGQKEANEVGGS